MQDTVHGESSERWLFRGQATAAVPRASLLRDGVDRTQQTRALRRFGQAFRRVLGSLPDDHLPIRATAQHHGIKTALLDFTLDPIVAVWFATHRLDGTGIAAGRDVYVYALPLGAVRASGASVALPHIAAQRIYRQRGVFLDEAKVSWSSVANRALRVSFPADPAFNTNRPSWPVDLSRPGVHDAWSEWLDRLADWAGHDETLEASPPKPEVMPKAFEFAGLLNAADDLMGWLCVSEVNGNEWWSRELLQQVAAANRVVACLVAVLLGVATQRTENEQVGLEFGSAVNEVANCDALRKDLVKVLSTLEDGI